LHESFDLTFHLFNLSLWDDSVTMVTRVRFLSGARIFFFSLPRPDQLWGPYSILSNGYRG